MFYKFTVTHPYQMKSAYLLSSLFVLLVSSEMGLCQSGSDDFMVAPMRIPPMALSTLAASAPVKVIPLTSTECKGSDSGAEHSYRKSPQGNPKQPH